MRETEGKRRDSESKREKRRELMRDYEREGDKTQQKEDKLEKTKFILSK